MNREMKCYVTADFGLYDTVYVYKPPFEKQYQFSYVKIHKRKNINNFQVFAVHYYNQSLLLSD